MTRNSLKSLLRACSPTSFEAFLFPFFKRSICFSSSSCHGEQRTPKKYSEEEKYQEKQEVHFGFAKVDKTIKDNLVHQVFSSVANKYDLMNDAMSFGIHRIWKTEFVNLVDPQVCVLDGKTRSKNFSFKILDLAGGTGDIAFKIYEKIQRKISMENLFEIKKPELIVCDINQDMLNVGKRRAEERGYFDISWKCANGENLPFEENSIDIVTIAFGIRNFTDIRKGLEEAFRVLKPGGRFLCLEFSKVTNPIISQLYDLYSFCIIPSIGSLIAKDRESYKYLVESIRCFPSQQEFAKIMYEVGFRNVNFTNLSVGVSCIHSGFKII